MKRVPTPELLDSDAGTPHEVQASLSDLWFINRAFGGVSSSRQLIETVAREQGISRISLLEVASGPGKVPDTVAKKLRQKRIELHTVLFDRSRSHLDGASRAVVGDAVALPFSDDSFDVVSSNLFVHHVMPDVLCQFINEGLRVCRTAVLINDLIRSPLHLALVYAGLPLFRSRITWHDAPASVRQAYTREEMRQMLESTAAARVEISSHYLFRMGVIAWKH